MIQCRWIKRSFQIHVLMVPFFVLFAGASVSVADMFQITKFDVPEATRTIAIDINDSGQIVGVFEDAFGLHGFLKDGDTFEQIDFPGAEATFVKGINNLGHMVGSYESETGTDVLTEHGFLKIGTSMSPIDVTGATRTIPQGINDDGVITGVFSEEDDTETFLRAFVLENSVVTPFDVPNQTGIPYTRAYGINNFGEIVGYGASALSSPIFIKSGDTFTEIGQGFPQGLGINDDGDVIIGFPDGSNIFVDQTGSHNIDLSSGIGVGINNSDHIVGLISDIDGTHGFLAIPVVPEPATAWLIGVSGLVLLYRRSV